MQSPHLAFMGAVEPVLKWASDPLKPLGRFMNAIFFHSSIVPFVGTFGPSKRAVERFLRAEHANTCGDLTKGAAHHTGKRAGQQR